jgi:hypothetical protein
MECPRCGGELETYSLWGRETKSCRRCNYLGVPVEHTSDRDDPESWDDAISRFYEKYGDDAEIPVDVEELDASDLPDDFSGDPEELDDLGSEREGVEGDAEETGADEPEPDEPEPDEPENQDTETEESEADDPKLEETEADESDESEASESDSSVTAGADGGTATESEP